MAVMAAILHFRSDRLRLFSIYKSYRGFLPSFESIGLSVQEKNRKKKKKKKNRLPRWPSWRKSWISDWNDFFNVFDVHVTPMLPTKFQVWRGVKKDSQNGGYGGHLGFPFGTILAFLFASHPDVLYQVSSQLAFRFG